MFIHALSGLWFFGVRTRSVDPSSSLVKGLKRGNTKLAEVPSRRRGQASITASSPNSASVRAVTRRSASLVVGVGSNWQASMQSETVCS